MQDMRNVLADMQIMESLFFIEAHFLINALADLRMFMFGLGLRSCLFEECFSLYLHFSKSGFSLKLTF